jgi:hypothetical protein
MPGSGTSVLPEDEDVVLPPEVLPPEVDEVVLPPEVLPPDVDEVLPPLELEVLEDVDELDDDELAP